MLEKLYASAGMKVLIAPLRTIASITGRR